MTSVSFDVELSDQIDVRQELDEVVVSFGPVKITFDNPQSIEALINALAEASSNLILTRCDRTQQRQAAEWRRLCRQFGPEWEALARDEAAKGLLSPTFIDQCGHPSTWPTPDKEQTS